MQIRVHNGWFRYTPEFEGNRESEKPMSLELRPFSAGEVRRHYLDNMAAVDGKDPMAAMGLVDATLRERCRNIVNLDVEFVGDALEGDLVEVIVEYGSEELKADIYQAIVSSSKLDEGLAKK